MTAMTMLMTTHTTISSWTQIQKGDIQLKA
jgi:hypothetical protein